LFITNICYTDYGLRSFTFFCSPSSLPNHFLFLQVIWDWRENQKRIDEQACWTDDYGVQHTENTEGEIQYFIENIFTLT